MRVPELLENVYDVFAVNVGAEMFHLILAQLVFDHVEVEVDGAVEQDEHFIDFLIVLEDCSARQVLLEGQQLT